MTQKSHFKQQALLMGFFFLLIVHFQMPSVMIKQNHATEANAELQSSTLNTTFQLCILTTPVRCSLSELTSALLAAITL